MGAYIAGHNDYRVFKVNGATLPVSESTIIEKLQQYPEDIMMRFFNLVEENYRIWFAAYRFCQLPPSS
jgi:hypothetical protein